MRDVLSACAEVLLMLFVVVFGVGAVILNLTKRNPRSISLPKDLQKEEHLETANPRELMASNPRSEELERRSSELADTARKRIRYRTREVLSRQSDAGDPPRG